MNAAQAAALAKLLTEAVHPPTHPTSGRPYDAHEMASFGEAFVTVVGYDLDEPALAEMLRCWLRIPSAPHDRDLHLDEAGHLWKWSTVPIPAEDCDCSCNDAAPFGGLANCPRCGDGVAELDCYRRVTEIGWQKAYDPPRLAIGEELSAANWPHARWAYTTTEGEPIRDVLAEHRAKALA